jgi:U3 small nucleolar RNA-associated protein 10
MNAEVVLQVFLPYHQSPNFPRMLSILTLPQISRYHAPFAPLIKSPQPIPRSYITQAVSPARDRSLRLLTDVAGMVQTALEDNTVHRGLLAFWSATMVELIEGERAGEGVSEGLVKVLVEAFVTILETPKAGQDVNVGLSISFSDFHAYGQAAVYPPLVLLIRSVRLADGVFLALLSALLSPSSGAEPTQRILTLLFILNERQDWEGGLGDRACAKLCKIKGLANILIGSIEKYGFEEAVQVVVDSLLNE